MLVELQIRNFAIIEQQLISFQPGLNVISGETGAGKSIVLNAIELILGARPRTDIVRAGSEAAEVQALFSLEGLPESLRAELPECAAGDELLLSRTVLAQGRGKVFINGRLGTVALLEEIAGKLINICGQNQQVKLLDPGYHRELLDNYGGYAELGERYRGAFAAWRMRAEEVLSLEHTLSQKSARRAELEDVVAELGTIELRGGIRAELEAELKRAGGAEQILRGAQEIRDAMQDEGGLLAIMQRISGVLHDLERYDRALTPLIELFVSGRTHFEELESDLRRYVSGVEVNEEQLELLRERLAEVARLERKYRCNDLGLVELRDRSRRELDLLDEAVNLDALRGEVEKLRAVAESAAAELTAARRKAGAQLSRAVERELAELSMKDTKLTLSLVRRDELGPHGLDAIEFLISTNKGEPAKPLKGVASGGELSRIMLVLKKVLRERTGVNVLVFDEVDAGISGGVARAVGEKLKALSRGSQVLCITHLPQVASLADHHILVQKQVGVRAVSTVRVLQGEERVDEIARMLAGYQITEASRESARELIAAGPIS